MVIRFLFFIVAVSFCDTASHAQIGPALNPGMLTNTIGSDHVRQSEEERASTQKSLLTRSMMRSLTKYDNSRINQTAIFYTPSSSRTKANLRNFVNKTRAVDPVGAAKLEQEFASNDIIAAIGSAMRKVGMNKNNVADAFALYWINSWSAAYADYSETSPSALKAVSGQAARALSKSPEFMKADDEQKQEMAEALLIQGALLDNFLQSAKGNPEAVRKVGQAAMQGAKTMGLDLDKMTLTENGFVASKKGSDAGEAVDSADPTASDKALASADGAAANDNGSEDDGLSTAQLALIAGAAGAGIAGVFLLGRSMGSKG